MARRTIQCLVHQDLIRYYAATLLQRRVIHSLFYVAGVKVVPLTIFKLLTPVGLAFWIMGDGGKAGPGVYLNVYAFKEQEPPLDILLLLNVLRNKLGVKCTVHRHKAGPRIYITLFSRAGEKRESEKRA
jgi:hypothetical protein